MAKVATKTKTIKETKVKVAKSTGLTTDVFDLEGKVVGKIELPKEVFAAPVNDKLIAQAVRVYLANQRQGTSSTKTRGEVAGSTRKIYRQKGTGRARHGSIKAPIFVGGGIIFGPKPRDLRLNLPAKMKIQALFSALTTKFKDKETLVITNLKDLKGKTKEMAKALANLKLKIHKGKLAESTLLVVAKEPEKAIFACRNIENLNLLPIALLNPYLIISNRKIIFTKEAIESFSNLWIKTKS